ncbi:low molecular weight phosphatase family protein [Pseudarthrobacter sp. J75]|uniref:arsenate reductase/protein-tyrosine-phosphatase family protein n=1 Tax=Pseudarthrobacter sp. J75 TaxID=3116486 RepID=UPI002E8226A8|nr:low molecular weight phosphatase family protein [Pseudarthrobacter sp. J75]MEE2528221.1 low molecular weight phosphatase family protein [Pseudarthrobacter sp. J75]
MQNSDTFRILTVCTGNICRSPVAERLLQKGLNDLHPGKFIISSAGTSALVGQPMQPLAEEIVNAYGGDPSAFAARQITQSIVRDADLVLVLTMQHRAAVLKLAPSMLKKTFSVREFSRMLDHLISYEQHEQASDVVDLWRRLPAQAAAVRQETLAETDADNDVIDPFRRSPAIYRQMEDELIPALNSIVAYARL